MSNVIQLDDYRKTTRRHETETSEFIVVKDMHDYRQIVLWLMEEGNEPLLEKLQGGLFRFYVDKDSAYYDEAPTMFEACEQATNVWISRELPESI